MNDQTHNSIGVRQWIIEQRRRRGWNQQDLADKCGYHRRTINRIEAGVQAITENALEKIAAAFKEHDPIIPDHVVLDGEETEPLALAPTGTESR